MKRIVFPYGWRQWGLPAAVVASVIILLTGPSLAGVYLITLLVGTIAMLIAEPPDWLYRRWLRLTGRKRRG